MCKFITYWSLQSVYTKKSLIITGVTNCSWIAKSGAVFCWFFSMGFTQVSEVLNLYSQQRYLGKAGRVAAGWIEWFNCDHLWSRVWPQLTSTVQWQQTKCRWCGLSGHISNAVSSTIGMWITQSTHSQVLLQQPQNKPHYGCRFF